MKAYGTPKTAMIHAQATFGGIGEASVTALETINILYEEGLIDNAAETGAYLIAELKRLQAKYPKIIKDVRGQGFMGALSRRWRQCPVLPATGRCRRGRDRLNVGRSGSDGRGQR